MQKASWREPRRRCHVGAEHDAGPDVLRPSVVCAAALLRRGISMLSAGRLGDASDTLQQARRMDPDNQAILEALHQVWHAFDEEELQNRWVE